MRAIKFVQWQSSILLGLTVVWTIGLSTYLILFGDPARVGDVVSASMIALAFVGPEKAAAFFGPHLKRKSQTKGPQRQ
ncbi:MAG: hypothetical protein ACLFS5_01780 [Spirochaetaceae bacterium]